jgi:hypothetical protein
LNGVTNVKALTVGELAEGPKIEAKTRLKRPAIEFKGLIFVKYWDHVLFHRNSAFAMKPQVREAVGWLVYNCDQYITLTWDRDSEPPTLHGGDPKASGLVLLKSDILEMKKID